MQCILVTGSDAAFFPYMQGLVRSILAANGSSGCSLGVMDAGLRPEQRAWVEERAVLTVEPEWDLRSPNGHPAHMKLLDSRMLLPRYFPGFDVYLWIDADAWVQDWGAIDLYVRAAAGGALGIVAEVNPVFRDLSPSLRIRYRSLGRARVQSWAHERYYEAYGKRTMRELALKPVMNSGIFALHKDAAHWDAWEASYRAGLARGTTGWINQIALNHAVYRNGLPVQYLPSRCNWTCSNALPSVDRGNGRLVEPCLPHDPLGIVHMTWNTKDGEYDLATTDGKTVRRSLNYPGASADDPSKSAR